MHVDDETSRYHLRFRRAATEDEPTHVRPPSEPPPPPTRAGHDDAVALRVGRHILRIERHPDGIHLILPGALHLALTETEAQAVAIALRAMVRP